MLSSSKKKLLEERVVSIDVSEFLTTAEVAQQYHVSERTVERWIERGLPAEKATQGQLLSLLASNRLKGLPPKGVWLIRRLSLGHIVTIRKPVGYPKGKKRKDTNTGHSRMGQ